MAIKIVSNTEFPIPMLDDLARSGLDANDARSMKLEYKSATWADENFSDPRSGYTIPYFDAQGTVVPNMLRFRFLDFAKPMKFAGKTIAQENQIKYTQPPGTRPYAYFSRRIQWPQIFASDARITFTEGEKKSEAACKAGFPTIGLGGVYSFRSAGREWFFLPELAAIDWSGKIVDICYDSDVMTKKEVHAALTELTAQLVKRGAIVHFIFLEPGPDSAKTGLDDYLLEFGATAFANLPRQQSKLSEAFDKLNARAGYIEEQGAYWDFKYGIVMPTAHARESLMPVATITINTGGKNPTIKETPAFELWRTSPSRRTMRTIVYEPGNLSVITKNGNLNAWRAPTITPKRGVVKPWLDLVHHVFQKTIYVDWFLKWLAYPLQVPGTKHFTAVFVYGEMQGTGKSFIVTPLMEFLYGVNFSRIENSDLESGYNNEQANKQFLLFDEIYATDWRGRNAVLAILKNMITREKITVREKYQKNYQARDHVNVYATSNHPEALPLPPEDRRWYIIRATSEKFPDSRYAELNALLRGAQPDEPGPLSQAVLYHLLNKIDISEFNPRAPAPITEYRDEVIQAGISTLDEFAQRVALNPDEILGGRRSARVLLTPADLLDHYHAMYPKASVATVISMGMALGRYKQELPRREVRKNATAPKHVLYAIFDRDVWEQRSSKDWLAYHETTMQMRHA